MKVGIISDTHGLLRPEVFQVLGGVQHILHAGDLGPLDLLTELQAIAPVSIVWGNTDSMEVRSAVPEIVRVELAGMKVAVMHGHQLGSPTPRLVAAASGSVDLAVFGHSHQPLIQQVGQTLLVNPGSAGPRRFRQPVTVAIATIENGQIDARLVHLVEDEA